MNQTGFDQLICPVCGAGLQRSEDGRVAKCLGARTHCYDFSKSGYLNLAGPRAKEGDLKEAVQARRAFLQAGYYQPLSEAINAILHRLDAKTVVDAGCGEGYYTNRMTAPNRGVLGVDLSRAGIDLAARQAKAERGGATFVVGSLFELPIKSESIDAVTSLFAPCAEQEFLRVLRPDGHLLLVGAGERHLMGLKRVIYDHTYQNSGRADLPQRMEQMEHQRLSYTVTVEGQDKIEALFSMTPYYWRTSIHDKEKLKGLDELQTEVDFDIFLFRKGQ